MLYKIYYNLVEISPHFYIQHPEYKSSRIDHPLKYCNTSFVNVNAFKHAFYLPSYNTPVEQTATLCCPACGPFCRNISDNSYPCDKIHAASM